MRALWLFRTLWSACKCQGTYCRHDAYKHSLCADENETMTQQQSNISCMKSWTQGLICRLKILIINKSISYIITLETSSEPPSTTKSLWSSASATKLTNLKMNYHTPNMTRRWLANTHTHTRTHFCIVYCITLQSQERRHRCICNKRPRLSRDTIQSLHAW